MNRLSQTLWKYDSETEKANLRDPPVKDEFGGSRRPWGVIVKESVSRNALSQSDAEGFYRPRW